MNRSRTETLNSLETAFIIEWFLYRMDPYDRRDLKDELPLIYAKLYPNQPKVTSNWGSPEVERVDDDGIPF
jgi:hypothetical protein